MREKIYLMVNNQLKRLRTLLVRNLSLFTRVFGKNYGGDDIRGDEVYGLSRDPQCYASNFYVKELRIMLGE